MNAQLELRTKTSYIWYCMITWQLDYMDSPCAVDCSLLDDCTQTRDLLDDCTQTRDLLCVTAVM